MEYKLVAGLETHVELATKTKIYCSCSTTFGGSPNSQCCPVCTGMPGALPVLNKRVVEYAVRAGLALNCKINKVSKTDRKNYSYPDLPKAYQISQYDIPLCYDGFLLLDSGKKIRISRIHIEEDAGKLIHRDEDILVDYNRAGVPLIEIVTEPDIESTAEAAEYVEKLRRIMRYIGVSDCKMQEGSMRCDVNISVSKPESKTMGIRTEIKNMNSIANIVRAMEYEYSRQTTLLSQGSKVVQETLRFDDATGKTHSMRSKEDSNDYRFFREPDLGSVVVSDEEIDSIQKSLPVLPDEKIRKYTEDMGLRAEDARLIAMYRKVADFFESASESAQKPSVVANFILGIIFSTFDTEGEKEEFDVKITPAQLSQLVKLVEGGKLNKNLAKAALERMLSSGKDVYAFVSEADMKGLSDEELERLCLLALKSNPKVCADYKGGKDKAIMSLVGFVMRESRGRADAEKVKAELIKFMNQE